MAPAPRPEHIVRNLIEQIELIVSVQPSPREIVSIPRDWIEAWRRDLVEALRLMLMQT